MRGIVIKPKDSGLLTRGAFGLELRDIARQAEAMISAARAEAERIVAEAREQAASERERTALTAHRKGYENGHAEGVAAGRETAMAEARERFVSDHDSLVKALTALVEEFGARREALYAEARRDVVILAIVIASRIVKRFAVMEDMPSEAAIQACEEALLLVREANEVVVRVHPADAQALKVLAEKLSAFVGATQHVRIVEDPEVTRGGVLVSGAGGTIDAEISTRLDCIADELIGGWRERCNELGLEA